MLTRQNPDQTDADERYGAAVLALGRATEIEPDYADPYCFLAIVEYQFRDDAAAALPYIERCEASNPPGDVASLVASFADEIRSAN